jgi:ESS family glutamate:Na+ symporter
MQMIEIGGLETTTYAIIMLFIGKYFTTRSALLQRYSIPEPLIGGTLFAIGVTVVYALTGTALQLDTEMRDIMLVLFFTGIGLKADFKTLISGGKPLLILLVLASTFIFLQNVVGVSAATMFGMEPILGLMGGSISLTGGVGTTVAWAPIFSERFGLTGASDIGFACNTLGLISACIIGGPIARFLIQRNKLETGSHEELDVGICHDQQAIHMDHLSVLFALGALFIGVSIGLGIDGLLKAMSISMPLFVSCLIGGIIVSNILMRIFHTVRWPGSEQGLALISDICLGLFLTIALMGMQLWVILNSLGFVLVVITCQVLLTIVFTLFIVFRAMGRDYESAVICSGFGGITLGSTATAIVNMTAVATQYGAAHRAFIIVPLVAGFFIDLVNAVVINQFIRFLG